MKQSRKAYDLLWENYSILQEVSNFGYNQAKKTNKQTEYTPTHMTLGHTKPGGTLLLFAKTIDYSPTHFHTIITLCLNDVFHSLLIFFFIVRCLCHLCLSIDNIDMVS